MPVRTLLLVAFMLIMSQLSFAQSCPPNIDFEQVSFDGWEMFTGSTKTDSGKNFIDLVNSPAVMGRHELMTLDSLSARDPYGKFPKLCPYGGKASVKLGNDGTGGEAEGISYTFTVPNVEDTFSFTYFYAVVFQDPGHDPTEQPRFFVTAYEVETGALIDCASYDYVASGTIPGFIAADPSGQVLYKNWSPVTIQFAGLANKKVRLEFKTADCTLGGHFGYAYLDVGSGCSNILASAPYCIEKDAVVFNAPYGFQSYTWYSEDYSTIIGTGQSIKLSPAPFTEGNFWVDIVPYPGYGCRDTAMAYVVPKNIPKPPDPKPMIFCENQMIGEVYAVADRGFDLYWYSDTTATEGSLTTPYIPSSRALDTTFYVTQKELFGCESNFKPFHIKIEKVPTASFNIDNALQCIKGNKVEFASTSSNISSGKLIWDFGDGTTDSTSTTNVQHKYTRAGYFPVKLTVINNESCMRESYGNVTIGSMPNAMIWAPTVICENQPSIQLLDNSTVTDYGSYITDWHWNIDGNVSTAKQPATFPAGGPHNITVRLSVSTNAGCESDTLTRVLTVRSKPIASFAYSSLLCDNEPLAFTDLSKMPAGSPDQVARWEWQLDGGRVVTQKNPVYHTYSGLHNARLIAESNYGCKSDPFDSSMFVHPKPNIALVVNDSCVRKDVYFDAVSRIPNVTNWYWNMGKGLFESGTRQTEKYRAETQFPVTLIGKTDQGCKDTAFRAFRIFENHSFAGRDTIVAKNEPVRLNARGGTGVHYSWTPSLGLNADNIENPIATLATDQLYKLYSISDQGCEAWSQIFIKRYEGPELYIPNAFTPNSDGKNDQLKVFPVGIRKFHFLAVYNRSGQLLFKTNDYTKGWNGYLNGTKMDAGTYVAVAEAEDYRGKTMMQKTTVILIR
ncbi:MAG: PKD domain-containing protein [Flavitalea sp.]